MAASVTGVRSVALGVRDLAASKDFYTRIWGLDPVAETKDAVYLRGGGADHHIVSLHARPRSEMLCIEFTAADRKSLEELRKSAIEAGAVNVSAIADVAGPGGGHGFTLTDPEGRHARLVAGDRRHTDGFRGDRPAKLSHIVLNSGECAAMADFYGRALGFRVIDRTHAMTFLNCSSDHHSLAFANDESRAVNHIAFEMHDIDGVMSGAGRLRENGVEMQWGVGRHGPGHNVFAYFIGPDGEVIEYTAEVEQVDASYKVGAPGDWKWPNGRRDQWGIAIGPTERMKQAQSRFKFAEDQPRL